MQILGGKSALVCSVQLDAGDTLRLPIVKITLLLLEALWLGAGDELDIGTYGS